MRGLVSLLGTLAIMTVGSVTLAQERAATSELPAALQTLGIAETDVVTADQAHQVRGKTYDYYYYLRQSKDFSIDHGVATGSTTLLEGVFGTFKFVDFTNGETSGTSLTVEGTFGGLIGSIGVANGGLQYEFLGKSFQESFDFAGKMDQDFSQSIKIPVPVGY